MKTYTYSIIATRKITIEAETDEEAERRAKRAADTIADLAGLTIEEMEQED